jgi:carbon-monoxide dehydrogenase medium subunit
MFRNLPHFEFLSPKSIEEAISLLAKYGSKAKVIAGGTDLVPEMRWGQWRPQYILSLSQIPGLDEIQFDKATGLRMGAACTIGEIVRSEVIGAYYPLLAQAASVLGSMEIRNRATVGGNLCTAAPSADMPPSLLVLGTKAVIATQKGEKCIALEDFFTGPKKTILNHDEMLVRLEIPPVEPNSAGDYIKFGRRNAMEIAMLGVAALITLEHGNNTCIAARLAFATAAPTPMRSKEAEKVLEGKKLLKDIIDLAAETASKEASPRTSWRTTEEYRRDLIHVLICRAIQNALDKLKS